MATKPFSAARKAAANDTRRAAQDRTKPVKKKSVTSGQRKLSWLKHPDGLSLEEW